MCEGDRYYVAAKTPEGINVFGPARDTQEFQKLRHNIQMNHDKLWPFSIIGGKLNIIATPQEKEQILRAYYKRMGLDFTPRNMPPQEDDSEYIDPDVFDPNYFNKPQQANRYSSTDATISHLPH